MNKKIKVSILVPICNVEKYLPECLDSLINQTLKDIEIICINDGSTDSSLKIIKSYAKNDSRIVVIDKKNSGYGDSMNKGLEKAQGEYIGIVESDDFIDCDAFEILYKLAKDQNVEVVKSNFYEYFGESKQDKSTSNLFLPEEVNKVINPQEKHNIFYQPPCIWAAIYQRKFLEKNSISFLPTPGASYQDTGFNFKVWASAERVYFTDRAFLHYRQDNSNSSVKSSGKIYFVQQEYDAIEEFLAKKDLLEKLGPVMTTCRFGAYVWNLRRLTFKAAMEFSKVVQKDYIKAKKMGFLDIDKLDNVGKYNARLVAVKHPKVYIIFRPLHTFRNSIKPFISKTLKAVLPRYKQRLQTLDALSRLEEVQSNLKSEILKSHGTGSKHES